MDISVTVPFHSSELALLAYEVLSVDKELKRSGIQRKLEVNSENLIVKFHGESTKKLRVAVNSFIKNTLLVVKTIDQF